MDHFAQKVLKLASNHGRPTDRIRDDTSSDGSGLICSIQAKAIYRYRKQRGVNLGSWFTLERWIADAPFGQAQHPAQSDFDVARSSNAKEILEKHWDTWITEDDWIWLSNHGINTVRIPIGFYHICGADHSVIEGTDFENLGSVYAGAWARILSAIDSAAKHGIGVLIDLHAAPGKQNADAHSGQTGPVHFFEPENLIRTQSILCVLAHELKDKDNLVGLQLLNEPQGRPELSGWYLATLDAIRKVTDDLPLYIHDAWNTNEYASFVGRRADFTVVDHHLYRCFTPADQRLSGDEHAGVLHTHTAGEFARLSGSCRGNMVVAEFSAALNPASLRSGEPGEQDRQRREFARAELEVFERHCAGWFFWTYKKDDWDAGWSLRDAVTAAIMPDWHGIRRKAAVPINSDPSKRDAARDRALAEHTTYWSQYKGKYEHWRFDEGFVRGWEDAFAFFAFPLGSSVPELGFKGQWAKKQAAAHIIEKGSSRNVWEFEHGIAQGINAAKIIFQETY